MQKFTKTSTKKVEHIKNEYIERDKCCVICQEDLLGLKKLIECVDSCHHVYHNICMNQWLKKNDT